MTAFDKFDQEKNMQKGGKHSIMILSGRRSGLKNSAY